MWELRESGVQFRTFVHEDGTIERWQQPKLPAWELPKRDPYERRPRAPDYCEPEIATPEAASDDATGDDIAAQRTPRNLENLDRAGGVLLLDFEIRFFLENADEDRRTLWHVPL